MLCKEFENKSVCELRTISEYFGKQHKHLLENVRDIVSVDEELKTEFISILYKDEQGKLRPTYLVTKMGFFMLVSSFKGKKAIKWKKEFYRDYERMQKQIDQLQHENALLREITGHLASRDVGSLTKSKILEQIDQLQHENYIKSKLINEYEQCTYCITDLCCKFENLDPITANNYLRGKGIIEKRASGYYPSMEYLGNNICISATCVGDGGFVNYVRYTPKGLEYLTDVLVSDGYKLKEV